MKDGLPFSFAVGRLLLRVRPAPLASFLKRLFRIKRCEIATAEGRFWVDPASYSGFELAETGVYEPVTLGILKRVLHAGDTFIDIGANEGYFAVVSSRLVGPNGRVLAIEPQLRMQPVLQRNLAANHCANVAVVQAAISDRSGSATLYLTPDMNTCASGLAESTRYRLERQTTPLMTLGDLVARVPGGACVVKMDIEGYEHEAILGAEKLLRAGAVRILILEQHQHLMRKRGLDVEAIPRLLQSCGYHQEDGGDGRVWSRS
jgi:FkbM family methyltransferase